MSNPLVRSHFGTEAQCAEALERSRWPQGFRSPKCSSIQRWPVVHGARKLLQSGDCRLHVNADVLRGKRQEAAARRRVPQRPQHVERKARPVGHRRAGRQEDRTRAGRPGPFVVKTPRIFSACDAH